MECRLFSYCIGQMPVGKMFFDEKTENFSETLESLKVLSDKFEGNLIINSCKKHHNFCEKWLLIWAKLNIFFFCQIMSFFNLADCSYAVPDPDMREMIYDFKSPINKT
jgi:hypothetical protein